MIFHPFGDDPLARLFAETSVGRLYFARAAGPDTLAFTLSPSGFDSVTVTRIWGELLSGTAVEMTCRPGALPLVMGPLDVLNVTVGGGPL